MIKNSEKKRTLLVISCSKAKRALPGLVKAWDLYDGVIYRVLKKNKIDFNQFELYIISARYGLIRPNDEIEYYDQLMTKTRATELRSRISDELNKLDLSSFEEVYFCLGKTYLSSIDSNCIQAIKPIIIEGGIGVKMRKIKSIISERN